MFFAKLYSVIKSLMKALLGILKVFSNAWAVFAIAIITLLSYLYLEIYSDINEVVNHNPPVTTQIFDSKGRLIANLFDKEFRFYAKFDEIPPRIIEALLAIEDTLFFEHPGVNLDAIMRAMLKNIKSAGYVEGGSTITQQLIKNVVLTRDKTIKRKIKEMLLALHIETILSKEEILERYLNYIYFGHGFYGIKAASEGYFRKEMNELTLKEIAMLVSLPRAPSFYDPTKNYDFSLARANNVLQRMAELGWITEEQLISGLEEKPKVYNDSLTKNISPYVVDEIQRELKDIKDLKTGGYKILTSIDLDYQKTAEESLKYGYNQILSHNQDDAEMQEQLNGAFVALENKTGRVLALVGGVDYKKSNFNRATQSKRQIGSSVKPFLYLSAIDYGLAQNYEIPDVNRTYEYEVEGEEKRWQPKNYTPSVSGFVTLKEALRRSLNLATINLVEMIGFDRIYKDILKYGFSNVPKDLTISLGSFSASPMEMAKNFMIFSNYGKVIEPHLVDKVIKRNGEEIVFENEAVELVEAKQSFLVVDMLRGAVNNGTGRRAKVNGIEIAGKTGTTNNNVDSWFCGFSPSVEVVIWYGKDNNRPIEDGRTNGVAPATFAHFFQQILKNEPGLERRFEIPNGVRSKVINKETFYYTDETPLKSEQNTNQNGIIF